jgi:hypothetical protein
VLAATLPRRGGPSRGAAAALTTVAAIAGLLSAVGPRNADADETIVVFHPGLNQAAMMRAVRAADAHLKWADASGTIWAVDDVSWSGLATLYMRGALVVSSTPVLAGCLAWTRRTETVSVVSDQLATLR